MKDMRKQQLEDKFFSSGHPSHCLIDHLALNTKEILEWVYKKDPEWIAQTYILVDEIDSMLSQDSIRILNSAPGASEAETTLYVIDALQFISKFKFVFGSCMNVDENALRIILDQNKLNAEAAGKLPNVFHLGLSLASI